MLNTRMQRLGFNCVNDLKARHTIQALVKGHFTRTDLGSDDPRSPREGLESPRKCLTLERTTSFIECNICNKKHSTYFLKCVNCGKQLSSQNRQLLRFANYRCD